MFVLVLDCRRTWTRRLSVTLCLLPVLLTTLEILHWAKLRSWSAIDRTIRLVEPVEPLPTPAAA